MSSARIQTIQAHLSAQATAASTVSAQDSNDVVIVSALRTPVCKAKRGGFKDTPPDALLATVLKATIERTKVRPEDIGDIVIGNVLQPGGGAVMARLAQFLAGLPETIPLHTVNRQCSSGLQAVMDVAASIKAGHYDIGIGGGVESMSMNSMSGGAPDPLNSAVFDVPLARDCLTPMGITSENVAERYGVTREDQDRMAAESHAKLSEAQAKGWLAREIVPVTLEDGTVVDKDDGVRAKTTIASLAKLKPAFQEGGSTTAGNSSQMSDGAAAVLLARRSTAQRLGLPILGCIRAYACVGVKPDVMGIGPAVAIPAALRSARLAVTDIDVFEINEAFASQATYCVRELNIPREKLNPNGGAIAMGHPLGCTGARQIATLMNELDRRSLRRGVVSMCIGTGMGAAAVIERE